MSARGTSSQLLPTPQLIYLFFGCTLIYGVLMTLPIGGADMPVVISIYNAATGLAVGLEGFVLAEPGIDDRRYGGQGAAGTLLTLLMAQAMNRSVANVLFTNFGGAVQAQAKPHQRQLEADRGRRCRHFHALCQECHRRPRLWSGCRAGSAEAL